MAIYIFSKMKHLTSKNGYVRINRGCVGGAVPLLLNAVQKHPIVDGRGFSGERIVGANRPVGIITASNPPPLPAPRSTLVSTRMGGELLDKINFGGSLKKRENIRFIF
jgi:hypothetical protein